MKERPILFNAPMVRAILDGRKTQTRRLVSNATSCGNLRASKLELSQAVVDPGPSPAGNPGPYLKAPTLADADVWERLYPRWQVGDRLWAKETWAEVHPCQVDSGRFSLSSHAGIPGPPPVEYRVIYRADGEYPRLHFTAAYPWRERCLPGCAGDHSHPETWRGWRPSIYMPRWASRITLEVTEVRVQRLQEISEKDAEAEGADLTRAEEEGVLGYAEVGPREMFAALWDDINGKRAAWSSNPFVWAITFRRV